MRVVLGLIVSMASALLLVLPLQAHAQWPEEPIKMVLQFKAGGGGDQTLLPLKPLLEAELGQPLLYNYKPGASSRIGTEYMHANGAQGYTIGALFLPHFVNSTIFAKPVYTVADFVPVGIITTDVPIWFVNKNSPYKDMQDLIADAKKRPGEVKLAIGSFTGEHYITVALVEERAGVKFRTVNVKGGSKVMSNIVGGHFDVGVSRPSSILRVRDDIRGIGLVGPERSKLFPEAPTLDENVPELKIPHLSSSRGLMASTAFKNGDPAGFARLATAFEKAVKSAEYAKTLDRMGLPLTWMGPDAAQRHVNETHEAMKKYKPLVDAAKAR
jgi:tripartite-type tricarboxylate transporter receptor subunit TctC